jgi:hypothetical protein
MHSVTHLDDVVNHERRITTTTPGAVKWKPQAGWNPSLENGGCANTTITVTENATQQDAIWVVDNPPTV